MTRTEWWTDWMFHKPESTLSILDVVEFGTVDFKLAGLLWLLMEHRASIIVASGPIWVGKTTLLHALLDFLPPEINKVTLQGYDEDFKDLGNEKPENTYLITEEISNHSYEYLWGNRVSKAFELLPKGYALGGTTHARNIKEVAYLLNALGVPLQHIAGLGFIITLQVTRGRSHYDEPVRYVDTVCTVSQTKDSLIAQILATRQLPDDKYTYPSEKSLHDTLLNKFNIKYDSVFPEIARREKFLKQLHSQGVSSREGVRKAVSDFYLSRLQ